MQYLPGGAVPVLAWASRPVGGPRDVYPGPPYRLYSEVTTLCQHFDLKSVSLWSSLLLVVDTEYPPESVAFSEFKRAASPRNLGACEGVSIVWVCMCYPLSLWCMCGVCVLVVYATLEYGL